MREMRDELGTMRDDLQVLTAMVLRLDGTVGLVLTELRAMHSQHSRLANRVRRLEEEREGGCNLRLAAMGDGFRSTSFGLCTQ
jgi:hypothetical protein